MSGPRVVARSKVAGTVLAILLVTVAAVAERLSTTGDYQLVQAPLDQTVAYGSGRLRISDVRVGTEVDEGTDHHLTRGMFVVVNVAVQGTGHDDVSVGDSQLLAAGGMTYLPALDLEAVVTAHTGFETSNDFVFEVDPTRITDLTLETWNSGFIYRYYQRNRTPLGITAANASRWAAVGAGQVVKVSSSPLNKGLG